MLRLAKVAYRLTTVGAGISEMAAEVGRTAVGCPEGRALMTSHVFGGSMFRRIESISQAAVWDRYDGRTSPAPDFARYNLIYGWNASGKTTLSRVFGLLNGQIVNRLPASAHVRVSGGQEVLDSREEQDRGRIPVCIFNRDFIDANLQQADCVQAPALFLVGEDNIRLSNRIASLARRRGRVAAMYRSVQTKQSETSAARDKAATDLARDCGTMLGVRDLGRPI